MTTAPVNIAILVFPETTGSVVYGMYDLFLSAGRDWSIVTEGRPGPELIRPLLVAKQQEPFAAGNGVYMSPHTTMAQCPENALICVPEVNLPPGAPLAGRYHDEIGWLKQRYAEGAVLASACSGAMLFAEAGLLDGCEATTHWAWCDVMRHRFPKIKVHPQRALVVSSEGQRLIMAGGGTSWTEAKVSLPSPQVPRQPIDPLLQADAPVPLRQLTDSCFEPLERFGSDFASVRPPSRRENKAQKLPFLRDINRTLRLIDLELQPSRNEAPKAIHHPLPGPLAFDIDITVIAVTHEVVPAPFQLLIQLIQHHIR
ncbi:Transcriptional regulator containing an amidase domain and an AraC-type DNA-binding HTH domain-like protein [Nitrosococcus halophilus Nc 4]|uniref:Transcriptional regulator containing an amidase domain and an AraC-type DNA-binding HTH domain-like protein n=1 Tax=Nitrosococcus halophilus (strain Nc4) TaxID=472759 RepID=D5BYS4_NITHN|nr:AraC family transcriptional regulator [Nitrosococcus halophilus]ADE16062.1 Transcriptional regulator containing an amidase domain and an AraC-type DNA-binding HTH domain-like protein [Nitrosococcus halophilus Nc 4]